MPKDADRIEPELVVVPAGPFVMGRAGSREVPRRELWLSAFAIGRYPVTNAEFERFVGATDFVTDAERVGRAFVLGSGFMVECANWRQPEGPGHGIDGRGRYPVRQVSWQDAQAYLAWLDACLGGGYRLPTDAEWEKAARGPEGFLFAHGDKLEPSCANVAASGVGTATPVDHHRPNGYGLHDVDGNVQEWVQDWSPEDAARYYATMPARDPRGPERGVARCLRGGAFSAQRIDNTCRSHFLPHASANCFGFRMARSVASAQFGACETNR